MDPDQKNFLLKLFSGSMSNHEEELIKYATENNIDNPDALSKEFTIIQSELFGHIWEITMPDTRLSPKELEDAIRNFCAEKHSWVNETGIGSLLQHMAYLCWHEGILK